jgi:hypothetical protein
MIEYASVLGERYGYRRLTRGELKEAMSIAEDSELEFEDFVCVTCVTEQPPGFPGWDLCLAGIPSMLCREIMVASGYIREAPHPETGELVPVIPTVERQAMAWATTPEARYDVLICFCFPRIALSDLDRMDPLEYYQYAAASQLIIGGVYGMDASNFLNPALDGKPGPPKRPQRPQGAPPPPPNSPYLIQ